MITFFVTKVWNNLANMRTSSILRTEYTLLLAEATTNSPKLSLVITPIALLSFTKIKLQPCYVNIPK